MEEEATSAEVAAVPSSYVDPDEFELRRRLPPRFPTAPNDVYVTLKTNLKAQLGKCSRLLEEKAHAELTIYGLGAAVNRAVNLALQLRRRGLGSIDTEVNTASVELSDDILPLLDDGEPSSRRRLVSAIHIRVFKTTNLAKKT